jgi:dTDP-glucose 4,6-dehydratase
MDRRQMLVTGGAGFIGSHFVEMAVGRGYSVIVLDALTYAGHPENLDHIPGREKIELVRGDIADAELVGSLLKSHSIQSVVNFAAESHVDRSITGSSAFIQTNVVGTSVLLEQSLRHWESMNRSPEFCYLQVSTDEVYGALGAEGHFTEQSAFQPNSPYSASKAGADLLVRAWHKTYGLPTITTHCSNNYGPRQYPEKLIPFMITCALRGRPLGVYGNGKNVRDWIHVRDHCQGIFLALQNGEAGSTYCFGGNEEHTNIEIVTRICETLDRLAPKKTGSYKEQITFVKDRLGHDLRYAIDDSLVRTELSYSPQNTFAIGLEQTIQWYLDNQTWCETVLKKGAE